MLQRFQRKPTFPLELVRVLDMLYETPEVSRDTRPHLRGMLKFPPQVKKSPVVPASRRDESIALLQLERNANIHVAPREEAGIYLLWEGNPGALSQFESHVFPHPLEIRPDFLLPIQM